MGNIDAGKLLAVSADGHSGDSFSSWRVSVLDQAAMVLADPAQPEIQSAVGVWDLGMKIPYPSRQDITILQNGCLVFNAKVAEHSIHFSVWMVMGEIRIGAKVPTALIQTEATRKKIATAYDGSPCSRQESIGDAVMFDWIFRTGFADFDTMIQALRDPLIGSVIAIRTGEILLHVYLAILSSVIETNQFEVRLHKISRPSKRSRRIVVVQGDVEAFRHFIECRGASVVGSVSFSETGVAHVPVETDDAACGISVGRHRGVDGDVFHIKSIEAVRH